MGSHEPGHTLGLGHQGTSTAGFIGPALWGPLYEPTQIFSWEEFVQRFGKVLSPGDPAQVFIGDPRSYLANAVQGFFDNGGSTAWIVSRGGARRAWSLSARTW